MKKMLLYAVVAFLAWKVLRPKAAAPQPAGAPKNAPQPFMV